MRSGAFEMTPSRVQEMQSAFNLFDQARNGVITAEDLESMCQRLGAIKVSRNTVDQMIASVSADPSAGVNFEMFCGMVNQHGNIFGLFDLGKLAQVGQLLAKEAGVTPTSVLNREFPGYMADSEFVDKLHDLVAPFGFTYGKCISCVSLCRDEITAPLQNFIDKKFSNSFALSSLGGMLTCGTTGFGAAHAHAPVVDGRERYLYIAMPHISVDAFGNIGVVRRPGRKKESSACGALIAFHSELQAGQVRLTPCPDDIEMSHLKTRLFDAMPYGAKPTLVELTKLTMDTILADLEHIISLTVDPAYSDYVVAVGVQVHGPKWVDKDGNDMGSNVDFVWPGPCYVVSKGEKTILTFASK